MSTFAKYLTIGCSVFAIGGGSIIIKYIYDSYSKGDEHIKKEVAFDLSKSTHVNNALHKQEDVILETTGNLSIQHRRSPYSPKPKNVNDNIYEIQEYDDYLDKKTNPISKNLGNYFSTNYKQKEQPKVKKGNELSSLEQLAENLTNNKQWKLKEELQVPAFEKLLHSDDFDLSKLIDNFPNLSDSLNKKIIFKTASCKEKPNLECFNIWTGSSENGQDPNLFKNQTQLKNGESPVQIAIEGFQKKDDFIKSFKEIYKNELDRKIDIINEKFVDITKNTINLTITDKILNRFDLLEHFDFPENLLTTNVNLKYPNLLIFPRLIIHSHNFQTGEVKISIQLTIYDSKTFDSVYKTPNIAWLVQSKNSKKHTIKLKPNPHYFSLFNDIPEDEKPKINKDKLEKLIDERIKNNSQIQTTKTNKNDYFPTILTHSDIESTLDNWETKPKNLFFDYEPNGTTGKLTVRLIERIFDSGQWPVFSLENKDKKFGFTDEVVQTVEIDGFKKFDDLQNDEKKGFKTFREWYVWNRTFIFSWWNPKYHNNLEHYNGTGTSWLAHKISDTKFIVSTNNHVVNGMDDLGPKSKGFGKSEKKEIKPEDIVITTQLKKDDPNYDITKWLSFKRPTRQESIDATSDSSTEKVKFSIETENSKVTSIKIRHNFMNLTDSKNLSEIVAYKQIQPFYQKDTGQKYLPLTFDLTYLEVDFDNANNEFNNIWTSIGPTSYSPFNEIFWTNPQDRKEFNNLKGKSKVWNDIFIGSYPDYDDVFNKKINTKTPVENYFVFLGEKFDEIQKDEKESVDKLFSSDNIETYPKEESHKFYIETKAFPENKNKHLSMNIAMSRGVIGGSSGSAIYDKSMSVMGILYMRVDYDNNTSITCSDPIKNDFIDLSQFSLYGTMNYQERQPLIVNGKKSNGQSTQDNSIDWSHSFKYDLTKVFEKIEKESKIVS